MDNRILRKILALAVIVLIVEAMAGIVMFTLIKQTAELNYYDRISTVAELESNSFAKEIEIQNENVKNGLCTLNYGYVELSTNTVFYGNLGYEAKSFEHLNSLKNDKNSFLSFSELLGIDSSEVYVTYNFDKDGNRYFYYEKVSLVFAKLSSENVGSALVSKTGRIVYSDILTGRMETYDKNFEQVDYSTIAVDENNYFSVKKQLKIEDSDLGYIVSLFSYSETANAFNKLSLGLIAVMITEALIVCGVYVAFLLKGAGIKIVSDDKKRNYNYYVKTDVSGKVVSGNKAFSSDFTIANLFNYIIEKQTQGKLRVGDNIWVSCTLGDGLEHIVNFIVVKSGSKFFEFIGNREDALIGIRGELSNIQKNVDTVGDVKSIYGNNQKEHSQFLFGVFFITNYNSIEVMFGRDFVNKYFSIICQKVKQLYGNIYILQENEIAVFVNSDVQQRIANLKEDLLELNKPIDVAENTLKVECLGAFVHVDSSLKEADYVYAMKCVRATYRRLTVDKNSLFYVYHESQNRYYKKYFEYDFDIEAMIQNDSFMMEFQPQYSLKDKKIVGFEALFRIKPTLQLEVNIYEFIVYAERIGKIMKLSDIILKKSFEFAKSIEGKGVSVSVNISPIQFLQDGFVSSFLGLYNEYKLQPNSICVEITESFFISNFETMIEKINEIRKSGIKIHLDDFGTSYSSLVYLKRLPIDTIKIDKCFIDDVEKNNYGYNVVKLVNGFARELHLEVIVEGVETDKQYSILEELGVDQIQGFLIGKSMQEEKARAMLEEKNVYNPQ